MFPIDVCFQYQITSKKFLVEFYVTDFQKCKWEMNGAGHN